jgi:hypothetical protein
MTTYLAPQRGIIAIPVIVLACLLALVAAWGMRSRAASHVEASARQEDLTDMSVKAEASAERSAQSKTTIEIFGDRQATLVEFMSQSRLSESPNLSVVVPASTQVVVRLKPDSYRVHVTPVDQQSANPLQDNPKSVSFVEVNGSSFIIDLSRLSTNRLPFPRSGS